MRPKTVKFTRKVTSKTTVTTEPRGGGGPLKSCLKQMPSRGSPSRSAQCSPRRQLQSKPQRSRGEECLPSSRMPLTEEQQQQQLQNRQSMRTLHKLQMMKDERHKKIAAKQGIHEVLPIIPEACELGLYNLPKDRGPTHYKRQRKGKHHKHPKRIADDSACMDPRLLKPPFLRSPPSPPSDFSRYHQFLDNYAPYAGDFSSPPCPPPTSPIEDYATPLMYDSDCAGIPGDEELPMYGPPGPEEELLDDPAFFPLAGSLIEGGLMDLMPRVDDLPEPMQPVPCGIGVGDSGPSQHGFPQPESTRRHKMVGWHGGDPEVRLYRPDLPPSSPYEPYPREYGCDEEEDLIGLHSPPYPPSQHELKRLRYTPPPISPPDHPYRGMMGEDPWMAFENAPCPEPQQYSPLRPQAPCAPSGQIAVDWSPDHDMGEARWFHQALTGHTTPPEVRPHRPRTVHSSQVRRCLPRPLPPAQIPGRDPYTQGGEMSLVEWMKAMCPAAADPFAQPERPLSPRPRPPPMPSPVYESPPRQCQRQAGGINIRSPPWVPPHRRQESPCDLDESDEWRRNQELKFQGELDRRMQKHGVGQYRRAEPFKKLLHCHDPSQMRHLNNQMEPGPSSWFENFKYPSPRCAPPPPRRSPSPPPPPRRSPEQICEMPRAVSAGRGPSTRRAAPAGGPPKRRQPPPVPQFKAKMKIDKLPEHLKGKGPKELTQRDTGPDECQMADKQQKMAAVKARREAAKAYAAQQRQANKTRKC